MTDLELLQSEALPRSAAAIKRLGGRVDSIFGFIAYGVLWLFPSFGVATVVLFAGIALTGDKASPLAGAAVMVAWVLALVLGWLPFVRWVRRRRRAGWALVRDGGLQDGAVENVVHTYMRSAPITTAAVCFGDDLRAVFSLGGHQLASGDVIPVLFLPGAEYCLVFAAGGGAVPARIVRDLTIQRDRAGATITLARGKTEKFFVGFILLVVAPLIYVDLKTDYFQTPAELRCVRQKKDECTLSGHDIFGGSWHSTFFASGVKRSEVRTRDNGESEWVIVRSDGSTSTMGSLTDRAKQVESYRRQSEAFSAFLADRTQRSFEARYDFMGGPGGSGTIVISVLFAYILFSLLNGWRTTLAFDSVAGTLAITRAPALLPPSRCTLQLADLSGCEAKSGRLWILLGLFPILKIRLLGKDGKVVFKRRLVTSDDAHREVAAIQEILTPDTSSELERRGTS